MIKNPKTQAKAFAVRVDAITNDTLQHATTGKVAIGSSQPQVAKWL